MGTLSYETSQKQDRGGRRWKGIPKKQTFL